MKLVWEHQKLSRLEWKNAKVISGLHQSWDLICVMDDTRYAGRVGTMYHYESGYKIYPDGFSSGDIDWPVRLPADLTIDEAKDAAKLILAAGRQS
jgi:hypothetical protein